jgi:hypothetical protein
MCNFLSVFPCPNNEATETSESYGRHRSDEISLDVLMIKHEGRPERHEMEKKKKKLN